MSAFNGDGAPTGQPGLTVEHDAPAGFDTYTGMHFGIYEDCWMTAGVPVVSEPVPLTAEAPRDLATSAAVA